MKNNEMIISSTSWIVDDYVLVKKYIPWQLVVLKMWKS